MITAICNNRNWFTAILMPKNVVHNSLDQEKLGSPLFQAKKTDLKLFGAQKMYLITLWSKKNL